MGERVISTRERLSFGSVVTVEVLSADSDRLTQLAADAGLKNVVVVPVTQTIRFPSALDYVWLQLMATPQARLLSKMMAPERDAMIQVIAQDLASALGSVGPTGEISSAQECNVLTATR